MHLYVSFCLDWLIGNFTSKIFYFNTADIIEDPSNRDVHKPETKDNTTDTELQVILISDTESVDDGQGTNEELVNTNVKPTKRKLEEEEGQMKKIKGGEDNENLDCDKGVQHVG